MSCFGLLLYHIASCMLLSTRVRNGWSKRRVRLSSHSIHFLNPRPHDLPLRLLARSRSCALPRTSWASLGGWLPPRSHLLSSSSC